MHDIVTYATGMYSQLYKISSEIHILNFGFPSSGQSVFARARMWGSIVIFRIQKGPRAKTFGTHGL